MVSEEESQLLANDLLNGEFQQIEGYEHLIEKNDLEALAQITHEFFAKS